MVLQWSKHIFQMPLCCFALLSDLCVDLLQIYSHFFVSFIFSSCAALLWEKMIAEFVTSSNIATIVDRTNQDSFLCISLNISDPAGQK
jgi:hypothetical protein